MGVPTGSLADAILVLSPTIPTSSTPLDTFKGPKTGDWSSLIGIVTAICGNVIISFALNTQRYAHVRIEREALGQDPNPRHSVDKRGVGVGNEQIRKQHKIAEEQSTRNAQSEPELENGVIYAHDYHESDPLLPKAKDIEDDSLEDEEEQDEKSELQKRKNYLRSPFWWFGISLMVVGEAGNFLAYGFAPASIVSPLGVVALVSNCLIAPIMLKERFRKRDFLGIVIAVAGAVTVVLSAKGSNPKLGPDSIWDLIKRWEFLTYLAITVVLINIFMFLSNKYGQKYIAIDIGLVGLYGGYTALSTKGVASLLSYRLLKVFTFPITYLLVAILAGTAVMQIKYMNRALQRFNSTQVIPTQFVVFTISVVLGSAILYRDFEKTSAADVGKFVGGVVLTFLGVWVITSGRSSSKSSSTKDEEQEIDMVDDEGPSIRETPPSAPATPPSQKIKAISDPATPNEDSPASFVSATSRLAQTPLKPPMQTAASSPLLPSQRLSTRLTPSAQSKRPASPLHTTSDIFSTPQRGSQSTPMGTSLPREWLKRNSISGMLPGPYTSPLSGGLSVIVADSRRRDEDRRASLDRRRSTKGGGKDPDIEGSISVFDRLKRNHTVEASSGTVQTGRLLRKGGQGASVGGGGGDDSSRRTDDKRMGKGKDKQSDDN